MPRTSQPVRRFTAEQLDIPVARLNERTTILPADDLDTLAEVDAIFAAVRDVFHDGYGGAVLVGPPGTGKTYYAQKIAVVLAGGDQARVRFTQFHPSYQYEDFVEGWVPNSAGGFDRVDKHFCAICKLAYADDAHTFVIVIDELSRCDAARVFGEALTYIETTKRGQRFLLASGSEMVVPKNVFIIATMNPWDRGVDEVDTALLRRFAQIPMSPQPEVLEKMLSDNGLNPIVAEAVVGFLQELLKIKDDRIHIGHAYFNNVRDNGALRRLWTFQLAPLFRQAARSDFEMFRRIEAHWNRLITAAIEEVETGSEATDVQDTPPTTSEGNQP